MPELRPTRIGYGAGARDLPGRANVLRAILGETGPPDGASPTEVVLLETNLDDLTPELAGAAMERLLAAGALDVWFTPAQMKKNRPGVLLAALAKPADASRLGDLILRETSAFGLRFQTARRTVLAREQRTVDTPFGPIAAKAALSPSGETLKLAPEFESCRQAAERHGIPVLRAYEAALAACARCGGRD